MKKSFTLIIVLFIFFAVFRYSLSTSSGIKTNKYEIDKFIITETFTQKVKNEIDNYYIEVVINDTVFSIQLFDNFNSKTKIIKEIKYFKNDNYECILPIFQNKKVYTDFVCKKDYYYNYQDIIGLDNELDSYVESIKEYDKERFNQVTEYKERRGYKFYLNQVDNNYLAFDQYNGIILFNPIVFEYIPLFSKDIYKSPISAISDYYYVIADYNGDYDFHKFFVINLKTGSVKEIISDKTISYDSYVQGVIDNEIYIIDRSNKKQYELNLKTKTIIEIGNEINGIKVYENSTWTSGNIYEALNKDLLFNTYEVDNKLNDVVYDKVDKIGNKLSGYYYAYKKIDNEYYVYRANVQNTNNLTYLFKTNNIKHMHYENNIVYFKNEDKFQYYKEGNGVKTIAQANEFNFNDNLDIHIYIK